MIASPCSDKATRRIFSARNIGGGHGHEQDRTVHGFTQDILGRYICNGFDEAMDSMDNNSPRPHVQSDARSFWRPAEAFPESSPAAATYTEMRELASEMQPAIGQRSPP